MAHWVEAQDPMWKGGLGCDSSGRELAKCAALSQKIATREIDCCQRATSLVHTHIYVHTQTHTCAHTQTHACAHRNLSSTLLVLSWELAN
jgi:hypothetical protein